jgi:hypothetical protein
MTLNPEKRTVEHLRDLRIWHTFSAPLIDKSLLFGGQIGFRSYPSANAPAFPRLWGSNCVWVLNDRICHIKDMAQTMNIL